MFRLIRLKFLVRFKTQTLSNRKKMRIFCLQDLLSQNPISGQLEMGSVLLFRFEVPVDDADGVEVVECKTEFC